MADVIPGGAPKAGRREWIGLAVIALVLVTGSVIYELGICPMVILATDVIVGSAPVERAGTASAISEAGGALGIAILGRIGTEPLGEPLRSQLLGTARDAFTHGFELAAGICAAIALAAAVIVTAVLRRAQPASEHERGPELALESSPR